MKLVFYVALFVITILPGFGDSLEFYVGTYTNGESKGIYRATIDSTNGALTEPELVASVENPSFLAVSSDRKNLYAAVETGKFKGEKGGGLMAYRIDENGGLTELSSQNAGGEAPCHVSISEKAGAVLVANYSGGNVAGFPLKNDGAIEPRVSLIQHEGSSVNQARQKEPHAHSIYVFGDGKYAASADLGTDSIYLYQLKSGGVLEPDSEIKVKAGSGPRHIAFHPTEKFAYVINEMGLSVAVFALKSLTGWDALQTISTLPEGTAPVGSTAEIRMHPSGKFVYGSNRGHDTIVAYEIDPEKGTLTWIENEPIRGKVPRGFAISPDGKYLVAAGQNSNTITVFSIDPASGALEFTGHSIEVPSPVDIEFR